MWLGRAEFSGSDRYGLTILDGDTETLYGRKNSWLGLNTVKPMSFNGRGRTWMIAGDQLVSFEYEAELPADSEAGERIETLPRFPRTIPCS